MSHDTEVTARMDKERHAFWCRFTASELNVLEHALEREHKRRVKNWRKRPDKSRNKMGAMSTYAIGLAHIKSALDTVQAAQRMHTEVMLSDLATPMRPELQP